ncbi:type II toxin-antitoxin system VapC family toxin [Rubrobacter aplysinae]|uniref:type II toxin-antitoxin system VapC family toxin n=1 Tax=Rubrobacter aplysinae TaxID=909625 RepID=UPI00064BB664|nr:type II toxin-antitoxin system VapC family toxin [Rubrobacter aplysinae]
MAEAAGGSRSAGNSVVLDASAVLALLYGEPGQDEIRERIRGAEVRIGAVNVSEVSAKLAEAGFSRSECRQAVDALAPTVHPFDEELAHVAGEMRPATKDRGLSLGDRACLALANSLGVAALTTDGVWDGLEGAEVIRR